VAGLTVTRAEAERRIRDRIAKGEELLHAAISSKADLVEARAAYYTWTEYNVGLLKKLFVRRRRPRTTRTWGPWCSGAERAPWRRRSRITTTTSRSKLRRLESVLERLELFDEPVEGGTAEPESQQRIARRLIQTLDAVKAVLDRPEPMDVQGRQHEEQGDHERPDVGPEAERDRRCARQEPDTGRPAADPRERESGGTSVARHPFVLPHVRDPGSDENTANSTRPISMTIPSVPVMTLPRERSDRGAGRG
jgi:hypothetical protein